MTDVPEVETNAYRWVALLMNAVVIFLALVALLILAYIAVDHLVTDGATGSARVGASDAIALITAGGAILTGILGAYFGVNIAHKSANVAQAAQAQGLEASKAAASNAAESSKLAIASAIGLDPGSALAQTLMTKLTT